jgi:hypothetical protein
VEKIKLALRTAFSAFVRNSTPNSPNGLISERHEVPVAFFEDSNMTRITILLCFVECACKCRTTRRVTFPPSLFRRRGDDEGLCRQIAPETIRETRFMLRVMCLFASLRSLSGCLDLSEMDCAAVPPTGRQ